MSKTSDANSTMPEAAVFWKRFGALGTDLLSKYRGDPFFRTETHIIALFVAFSFVFIAIIAASFNLLDESVSRAVSDGVMSAAQYEPAELGRKISESIHEIRYKDFTIIVIALTATTFIAGYVISRVTLAPARAAAAAQKQFIGNIAHELRTPLSIMKTNIEISLLSGEVSQDMRRTLDSTLEELDRISEIINNLLSLSALVKLERLEFGSIDLSRLTADAVGKFAQLAKSGDLHIMLRKTPDMYVWGNPTALQQIVSNLVKNALQYTPAGGSITLTVEPAPGNNVAFIVQDSGVGIARKDLFRIFEPFYRSDPSRTRASGGSGLGLAIVSELVKMHRGKIMLRSTIGRGTTVTVLLPGIAGRGIVGQELAAKEDQNEVSVDFSH